MNARLHAVIALLAATSLTVLAGCGVPEVDLPDTRGEYIADAVIILEEAGFEVEITGNAAGQEDPELWTVRSQNPVAAHTAPQGSLVTLGATSVLEDARDACNTGSLADGGRTLMLDMAGENPFTGDLSYEDILCVLDELHAPESVLAKMGATRSLDGRQSDAWAGIQASWSYHPNSGLDVILELGRS